MKIDRVKLRTLAKAIVWLFWSVVCAAAGCYLARLKDNDIVLVPKKLARYGGLLFGVVFAVYSAIGLYIGNLPGLAAMGEILPLLLFCAFPGFLVILIVWRLVFRIPGPALCPHCRATARRFWTARQFKPDLTLRGAFFGLRICKSCGCVVGSRDGVFVEFESQNDITLRKAVMPLVICAGISLGGVLSGLLATGLLWDSAGHSAISRAKSEIAEAGFSFELPANIAQPPDSQNAVYWFQKAGTAPSIKNFPAWRIQEGKSQSEFLQDFFKHAQSRSLTSGDLRLARKLVANHKEAVSLARIGTSMKSAHWGIDWSLRPTYRISFPNYANLIFLGQLLTCEAIVAASEGNTSLAVELVGDALFLADAADSKETITGQMISAALYRRALSGAEYVLPRVPLDLAERQWGPFFKPRELLENFRAVIQYQFLGLQVWTESLTWLYVMRTSESLGLSNSSDDEMFIRFYWPFLKLDLAASYRQAFRFLEAIRPSYYPEARTKLEKWVEGLSGRLWLLGATTMPRFDSLYLKTQLAVAQLRLAQMAMSAKRFHQVRGRWPQAVWELEPGKAAEPDVFRDPFSDSNFRLMPFKNGIMLYSVGPDGIDDQGAFYNSHEKGDIVWLCS